MKYANKIRVLTKVKGASAAVMVIGYAGGIMRTAGQMLSNKINEAGYMISDKIAEGKAEGQLLIDELRVVVEEAKNSTMNVNMTGFEEKLEDLFPNGYNNSFPQSSVPIQDAVSGANSIIDDLLNIYSAVPNDAKIILTIAAAATICYVSTSNKIKDLRLEKRLGLQIDKEVAEAIQLED